MHSACTSYTKVDWNVRGQYQFKTAEVTSDLDAAMVFGTGFYRSLVAVKTTNQRGHAHLSSTTES